LTLDQIQQGPIEGNCRLAVQDYFYTLHGLYLGREDVVLPEAIKGKGVTIKELQGDVHFFDDLEVGDIVYAERVRNRGGRRLSVGKERFSTENEWMTNLHLGVYVGTPTADLFTHMSASEDAGPAIWHASRMAGGTALWSIDTFCYYYQPAVARRIIIK